MVYELYKTVEYRSSSFIVYGLWIIKLHYLWNMDHQTMLSMDFGSPNYVIYGVWITKLYYLWIMNHQTILLWIMDHQAILNLGSCLLSFLIIFLYGSVLGCNEHCGSHLFRNTCSERVISSSWWNSESSLQSSGSSR